MIHAQGGVIVVDDFKKPSPLNMGVDAAVVLLQQLTKLSVLWPAPPPNGNDLEASVAVIPVPAGFDVQAGARKLRSLVSILESD